MLKWGKNGPTSTVVKIIKSVQRTKVFLDQGTMLVKTVKHLI